MNLVFRFVPTLLALSLLSAGCDSSTSSSSGTSSAPITIVTTLPVMDFESLAGDTVPGTLTGHNAGTTSGKVQINTVNPLAGAASGRISAILNGTGYQAMSWNFISLDHAWNSKFALDASSAVGIEFIIRANKWHQMDFVPGTWLYTSNQNDSGAQMNWRINVGTRPDTIQLYFADLTYPDWLFGKGRVCQVDSAKFCSMTQERLLSHLSGFNLTIVANSEISKNDTVVVDFDNVKLIY